MPTSITFCIRIKSQHIQINKISSGRFLFNYCLTLSDFNHNKSNIANIFAKQAYSSFAFTFDECCYYSDKFLLLNKTEKYVLVILILKAQI